MRRHFEAFDGVALEEQQSASPKIQKLLKRASKSGAGPGYPDFILQLSAAPDLLIVIECKASPRMHESESRARPADYAVDGALLYADYLRKEFDVLAIGVSGSGKSVRISHYLHLKSAPSPKPAFGEELLPPANYVAGYTKDPEKYRQDYDALEIYIRQLNTKLHTLKVSERDRSLLVSAVLIALERPAFARGFAAENDPKELAKFLVESVLGNLEQAGVDGRRLDMLRQEIGFLPMAPVLTSKQSALKEVIQGIDDEINSFVKTHQYRDVLGSIYVEFLRYANSDKGLGIVLTPPHITELFADLAAVNADSIVYDNCAGTGGFLISAMKRMIEDAKGNQRVERRIKKSQLFGVELQPSIFALAVANMHVHQDGKSNIEPGDCFNEEVVRKMRRRKPTVGLLNPPYKADKKQDTEELGFVLNNLDCLVQGGRCVALVPMQCALSTQRAVVEQKEQLMRKHTLEAVLSLPNELFFNSNVGVVSCAMVFTAHRAHPQSKEVFLGYFKDDGFEKRKTGGRYDVNGRWAEVKEKWLAHAVNGTQRAGLCVNATLSPTDEWAAEAYMDTDYSVLTKAMFEDTLHAYATYLFGSRLLDQVSSAAATTGRPVLDVGKWQRFPIVGLFSVHGSKTTPPRELATLPQGKYPYVTTQATDNGVAGFYDHYTEDGGVLTIDSAVMGYCSYQAQPFSASDHVEVLAPKFPMSASAALFLVTLLNVEQYRYNYGRKCSQKRLRRTSVLLPTTSGGAPDWRWMERFMQKLPYSSNL